VAIRVEKHAYMAPSKGDGTRVLVTRYWLRGLTKGHIDEWARELAPSPELLHWHQGRRAQLTPGSKADATQHERFRHRYLSELMAQRPKLTELRRRTRQGETLTLLCACHDPTGCHRTILMGALKHGLPKAIK
jgi:uncharacterized protein YeaO (DUF488 family)